MSGPSNPPSPPAPTDPAPAGAGTPPSLDELRGQLDASRRDLEQARQTIAALERRQRIDALLANSEAIDLEAARLLTEAAVAGLDQPDLKLAVEDLRRHRPYLFRRGPRPGLAGGGVMAARNPDPDSPRQAARQAAAGGDRRALLEYLRLRRRR